MCILRHFILIFLKKFSLFIRFDKNILKTIIFRILIIKFFKKQISINKNTFFFLNLKNFFIKKNNRIVFISNETNLTLNEYFKFKKNEINFLKNSLRFNVSLASYMGFKKIYLLGFDYLNEYVINYHWYECKSEQSLKKSAYEKQFFKKILSKRKSKIILINKNGKSLSLPSISYKDFCKKDLINDKKRSIIKDNFFNIIRLTNYYKTYKE